MFRSIKLRGKKENCLVCGENPTITELIDYVEFCGSGATDKVNNNNNNNDDDDDDYNSDDL